MTETLASKTTQNPLGQNPMGKKALLFVLITVMINSIGFGIMIPVLPDLLKELTGLPNNEAVVYGMWLTFVFALFQFIFGATFSTANAYVADISPPEMRAQNFGLIGPSGKSKA